MLVALTLPQHAQQLAAFKPEVVAQQAQHAGQNHMASHGSPVAAERAPALPDSPQCDSHAATVSLGAEVEEVSQELTAQRIRERYPGLLQTQPFPAGPQQYLVAGHCRPSECHLQLDQQQVTSAQPEPPVAVSLEAPETDIAGDTSCAESSPSVVKTNAKAVVAVAGCDVGCDPAAAAARPDEVLTAVPVKDAAPSCQNPPGVGYPERGPKRGLLGVACQDSPLRRLLQETQVAVASGSHSGTDTWCITT